MREVRHFRPGDVHDGMHRPRDVVQSVHALLVAHGSFMRTLEVDDQVIAVFGMKVRWAGVADVWAVVGEDARGHGLWLTRQARQLLDQFTQELALWRVGALVREDVVENRRWLEALGFEFEGVERHAGPRGEHLARYVLWTRSPKSPM